MKKTIRIATIFLIIFASYSVLEQPDNEKEWKDWKNKNGKSYGNDEEFRFKTWSENKQKIEDHNANPDKSYTLKINKFADLTQQEFEAFYLSGLLIKYDVARIRKIKRVKRKQADIYWDWRTVPGVVTPVKDQKQCGSCYTFSTTGALEGVAKIFGNIEKSFSEQQLVDCSKKYGNNGCNGGLMTNSFQYVIENGITTEDKYPYTASVKRCTAKAGEFKIKSYTQIPAGDLNAIMKAGSIQPISIAADATNWSFYSSGVFDNCATKLNHAILLVGNSATGWIVKNSWGPDWGENGFIILKPGNTCGCANMCSYPNY